MTKKEKALEIFHRLKTANPHPKVELSYSSPFELLVATIMSAQTTDKLVNTLTPALFMKYPTVQAMAEAEVEDLIQLIGKVSFPANKARNIKASAQIILEKHSGKVPRTMEELDALPGVARKTANVVLNNAFGTPEGIVVDTHVIRLANKLGLTVSQDPVKIEQDLMELIPKEHWIDFGNLLTLHGRHLCIARAHTCENCPLGDLCPEHAV